MSELFETAIVEKRNVLNELRSNNMTLQELRFFSIYLSKINPWDVSTRVVRFTLDDFQRIMGFGRLNLKQIMESADNLLCKIVHIPDENGMRSVQLFKECYLVRRDGEWFMEIDAHDKALPLMFNFKNHYFKYELWNALRLRSTNQVRMYEILKQYEYLGKREITVTELRELLGVKKNEYERWERFRVRILDSCKQALKEMTDICYTYERGKVGRGGKWMTIIFNIYKNTEYKDPLDLQKFIARQPASELLALGTMGVDAQLVGKQTFDDPAAEKERELYSKACGGVFDNADIRIIAAAINAYSDVLETIEDRAEWLNEMYNKMLVEAEKKRKNKRSIEKPAEYLAAMIEKEAPKSKHKQSEPSYDTAEWDRLVRSFDPSMLD